MKLNTPVPQPLPKECAKAAKIFKSFVDSGNNGLDGVIPRHVLENAKGFAIFTVFKAGFLLSARAGSGIVIARLDDGSFSCPSAIGTAGMGLGTQAGAEMTDFLVILNSKSAIRSFMSAGSLQLGGNMSIAVGPLGRNGEAIGSLSSSGRVASMYSYSKTKGLFGGLSIEGSVIVERQDANAQAYNPNVTAKLLLSGAIDPPPWTAPLIQVLTACSGLPGGRHWVNDIDLDSPGGSGYMFGGLGSRAPQTPSQLKKKKKTDTKFPPNAWGVQTSNGSYFFNEDVVGSMETPPSSPPNRVPWQRAQPQSTNGFTTHFDSDFVAQDNKPSHRMTQSLSTNPTTDWFDSLNVPYTTSPTTLHGRSMSLASSSQPWALNSGPSPSLSSKPEGIARAIALYDFSAVESGDLSFSKGDIIVILQKSDSSDDWWTGKVDSREGVFPANFVELV